LLDIKSVTCKPGGSNGENFWPDKQDRYWWKIWLNNGDVIEDFYWTKDKERGWPDGNDKNRFWFTIHYGDDIKMEGFSIEPDYEKGFSSKTGYWRYIKYTECGPIKAWMEEKDRNYSRRREREAAIKECQVPYSYLSTLEPPSDLSSAYDDAVIDTSPATGCAIKAHLELLFKRSIHLIHPEVSAFSPASADLGTRLEAAFHYAKTIAGYQIEGEQKPCTGFLHDDGGTLKKSAVMMVNTHTRSLSGSSSQVGHHWQCAVILPKGFKPLIVDSEAAHQPESLDETYVYFIDSLPGQKKVAFPKELKKLLTKGGCETISSKGVVRRHLIPPVCEDAIFINHNPNQQLGEEDSGWWMLYNVFMLLCTGSDAYLKKFTAPVHSREFAENLRAIWDLNNAVYDDKQAQSSQKENAKAPIVLRAFAFGQQAQTINMSALKKPVTEMKSSLELGSSKCLENGEEEADTEAFESADSFAGSVATLDEKIGVLADVEQQKMEGDFGDKAQQEAARTSKNASEEIERREHEKALKIGKLASIKKGLFETRKALLLNRAEDKKKHQVDIDGLNKKIAKLSAAQEKLKEDTTKESGQKIDSIKAELSEAKDELERTLMRHKVKQEKSMAELNEKIEYLSKEQKSLKESVKQIDEDIAPWRDALQSAEKLQCLLSDKRVAIFYRKGCLELRQFFTAIAAINSGLVAMQKDSSKLKKAEKWAEDIKNVVDVVISFVPLGGDANNILKKVIQFAADKSPFTEKNFSAFKGFLDNVSGKLKLAKDGVKYAGIGLSFVDAAFDKIQSHLPKPVVESWEIFKRTIGIEKFKTKNIANFIISNKDEDELIEQLAIPLSYRFQELMKQHFKADDAGSPAKLASCAINRITGALLLKAPEDKAEFIHHCMEAVTFFGADSLLGQSKRTIVKTYGGQKLTEKDFFYDSGIRCYLPPEETKANEKVQYPRTYYSVLYNTDRRTSSIGYRLALPQYEDEVKARKYTLIKHKIHEAVSLETDNYINIPTMSSCFMQQQSSHSPTFFQESEIHQLRAEMQAQQKQMEGIIRLQDEKIKAQGEKIKAQAQEIADMEKRFTNYLLPKNATGKKRSQDPGFSSGDKAEKKNGSFF